MNNEKKKYDSIDVARAAIRLAVTPTREAEEKYIASLGEAGVMAAAVDFGGDITGSIHLIIERAILASRKAGITKENHVQDGAIAGAAREAVAQVANKAIGLNGGGKIAVARSGEHLTVCVFMSIGLLHLNDVVIGLGHRSVPLE